MADNPKPSSALENVFLDDWREAGGDGERLRVAIDQVASLTDTSALTDAYTPVSCVASQDAAQRDVCCPTVGLAERP